VELSTGRRWNFRPARAWVAGSESEYLAGSVGIRTLDGRAGQDGLYYLV